MTGMKQNQPSVSLELRSLSLLRSRRNRVGFPNHFGCGLLILLSLLVVSVQGKVCWMLYQMADNDLESFIRQDHYELTQSDVIRLGDDVISTWVYYDHRSDAHRQEPLANVVKEDGSPARTTTRSQYMKWSNNYQAFVIQKLFAYEQNGDDPDTVFEYLETAMKDCIATGATEFFVEFSSHAGGFWGFGGDEDPDRMRRRRRRRLDKRNLRQQRPLQQPRADITETSAGTNSTSSVQQLQQQQQRRRRRRDLTQTNTQLAGALTRVLETVRGAPDKFDVIGFDACLMQAVGAADEYSDVAKFILASEAVEPGHGWSYDTLTQADSALGLAMDIQSNFLSQTHGYAHHLTPKTLSIVDTAKFAVFLTAWDTLCTTLTILLAGKDPEVFTQLNRARNQAISFTSVLDQEETATTNRPSALDIGSFLQEFQNSCVPTTESTLGRQLETTLALYNDMFVVRGVGEGTVAATGMHITWPVRSEYFANPDVFDQLLFDNPAYATTDASNWILFLQEYYRSSTPPATGSSVCTARITSAVDVPPGKLILQPWLSGITDTGGHELKTEIARETDWMLVEFGIDLTPLLDGSRSSNPNRDRRRHLQAIKEKWTAMAPHLADANRQKRIEQHPFLDETWNDKPSQPMVTTGTTNEDQIHGRRRAQQRRRKQRQYNQRHLQSKDYFILFGGDVAGKYSQSSYDAFWDRQFYLFEDSSGNLDFLYVFDNGNGQKEVPVIYIPPSSSSLLSPDDIYFGLTEQEAISRFGGEYGYLSFSLDAIQEDDNSIPDVLLYTSDGSTYSEKPRNAGGQILPIIYVEGKLNGREIDVLVGGFFGTIIDWSNEDSMQLFVTEASAYLDLFAVNYLVVDVLAVDDDNSAGENDGKDFMFFVIDKEGNVFINDDSGSSSGASRPTGPLQRHSWVVLILTIILTFTAGWWAD